MLKVIAECEAGHRQEIGYSGVDRAFVEGVAGLMDGSSPMYIYPPGPESVIGKCTWIEEGKPACGAKIRCSVVDDAGTPG